MGRTRVKSKNGKDAFKNGKDLFNYVTLLKCETWRNHIDILSSVTPKLWRNLVRVVSAVSAVSAFHLSAVSALYMRFRLSAIDQTGFGRQP
jgi:hypothetical protein